MTSSLEQQNNPPKGKEQGDAHSSSVKCPEDPPQTISRLETPDEALTIGKQCKSRAKTGENEEKNVQFGVKGGQAQTRPKVHDQKSKIGQGEGLKSSQLRIIEGHLRGQEKSYKPGEPPDPHSSICRIDAVEFTVPEEELEPGPSGTPDPV